MAAINDVLSTEQPTRRNTRRYIMRETRIDRFTVRRQRVELTPTMCTKPGCFYDVCKVSGFEEYAKVPLTERDNMMKALAKHTEVSHAVCDEHIVDESTLGHTWLGNPNSF